MKSKFPFVPALIFFCLLLESCSTTNQTGTNPPNSTNTAAKHPEHLALKVTGGSDGSTASASQISNPFFVTTLSKTIHDAALFAHIVPSGQPGAEYQLEVAIAPLQPPTIGAEMVAIAEANWTLTRVSNGAIIWQKNISTPHTTNAKEAFTGIERVQLAIEGAAQDNIKEGITQLSAISLP